MAFFEILSRNLLFVLPRSNGFWHRLNGFFEIPRISGPTSAAQIKWFFDVPAMEFPTAVHLREAIYVCRYCNCKTLKVI